MRAERSFPMPFHSRSCTSVRPATGSGLFATASAPLRYARILNGLSPRSSSRSAISLRTRATARLSIDSEALGFDAEVEQLRPCPDGAGDEIVDHRCGHARREALPVVPLLSELHGGGVPVTPRQRFAHASGGVAN